tara:strand:- start:590 stop:709 length:120 start_codon:yes stop_codon:yes gene_type:complete
MNWIELEGLSKEDKIYLMKVLRGLIEEEGLLERLIEEEE